MPPKLVHIDEHGGRPQPAILARIAEEQEQKRVRLSTAEVPTEVPKWASTGMASHSSKTKSTTTQISRTGNQEPLQADKGHTVTSAFKTASHTLLFLLFFCAWLRGWTSLRVIFRVETRTRGISATPRRLQVERWRHRSSAKESFEAY